MTSRIRRVAMLAVLPVTVSVLGVGLASPASASGEGCCGSPCVSVTCPAAGTAGPAGPAGPAGAGGLLQTVVTTVEGLLAAL